MCTNLIEKEALVVARIWDYSALVGRGAFVLCREVVVVRGRSQFEGGEDERNRGLLEDI